MLAKAKEKGGGTGKFGTGAIQSVDSMFVAGPKEIGRKAKKRDINMMIMIVHIISIGIIIEHILFNLYQNKLDLKINFG